MVPVWCSILFAMSVMASDAVAQPAVKAPRTVGRPKKRLGEQRLLHRAPTATAEPAQDTRARRLDRQADASALARGQEKKTTQLSRLREKRTTELSRMRQTVKVDTGQPGSSSFLQQHDQRLDGAKSWYGSVQSQAKARSSPDLDDPSATTDPQQLDEMTKETVKEVEKQQSEEHKGGGGEEEESTWRSYFKTLCIVFLIVAVVGGSGAVVVMVLRKRRANGAAKAKAKSGGSNGN